MHLARLRRKAFTLVELVIVVLVLGIIAAIAAPKMFDTANDARQNATRQSLAVIRDAIQLYRAANGALPGDSGTEADDVRPIESDRLARAQPTVGSDIESLSVPRTRAS